MKCHIFYNGGQKNLGLCEKPFQAIVTYDPAPKENFLFGLGFILSSFRFPYNVVAIKGTHFHPFCSKFNFGVGGEGSLVLVISLERSQHF